MRYLIKNGVWTLNGDNNGEYYVRMDRSIPHVIIKFEDLLFRPHDIIFELCQCVNGL